MWPADEELRTRGLELYDRVWPFLSPGIRQAHTWGSDWFEVSTPFYVELDEQVVAHTGVVHCDWSIDGKDRPVAAIHAVCVHPDHRGKGLGRRVIEAALEHIDRLGIPTTILWSGKDALYRKFGFSVLRESVFRAPAPTPAPTESRRLDVGKPEDLAILRRVLAGRRPISDVAAGSDSGWHFFIDLALWEEAQAMLVHLPERNAVVVGEAEGRDLRLYDLLAERPVPAAELVGAFQPDPAGRFDNLAVHFTPDRLDLSFKAATSSLEDFLMVRGEPLFSSESRSFAFSPLTRT